MQVFLKPLEREGLVDRWDDTRITPGQNWKQELRNAIDAAKVAVLLTSADFLASDFIMENELPPLLAAAQEEGLLVIPVLLSPSLFGRIASLSQFEAINDPSKTLSELSPPARDRVWIELAGAIEEALTNSRLVYAPDLFGKQGPRILPKPESPISDTINRILQQTESNKEKNRAKNREPNSSFNLKFNPKILYYFTSLLKSNYYTIMYFTITALIVSTAYISNRAFQSYKAGLMYRDFESNERLSPSESESLWALTTTARGIRYKFIDLALENDLAGFELEMAIHAVVGMDSTIRDAILARVDSSSCTSERKHMCGSVQHLLSGDGSPNNSPLAKSQPIRQSDPDRKFASVQIGQEPRRSLRNDNSRSYEAEYHENARREWDDRLDRIENKIVSIDILLTAITNSKENNYVRQNAGERLLSILDDNAVFSHLDTLAVMLVFYTERATQNVNNGHSVYKRLGEGLSFIAETIDAEDKKAFAILITEAITRSVDSPLALEQFSRALKPISKSRNVEIPNHKIVNWLKWPTCIRECRDNFLTILFYNTNTDGNFRTLWDVASWAEKERRAKRHSIDIYVPPIKSESL